MVMRTVFVRGSIAANTGHNHGAYPIFTLKAESMPILKSSRDLVDEAMEEIRTYTVADVLPRLNDPQTQLVDVRAIRELAHGTVVGAFHAPRGMLEFWVDPESPYHKPLWADESKEFILFCGAGWRSALAAKALKDMGMTNVAHIDGGFAEWVKQAAPVENYEAHRARRHPAK